ncbi:hypothetical protein FHS14_001021 [Paenibacillus baekrokdamisoli]|nr:hypothetical protein [Paenibacillus baekrokdamisoli]
MDTEANFKGKKANMRTPITIADNIIRYRDFPLNK